MTAFGPDRADDFQSFDIGICPTARLEEVCYNEASCLFPLKLPDQAAATALSCRPDCRELKFVLE